ncbi:hypothetical protein SHJJP8907_001216 [Staphylococcus lugdunensis]|nr:hypothetical protein [Staphylococcus lugdunensis]
MFELSRERIRQLLNSLLDKLEEVKHEQIKS